MLLPLMVYVSRKVNSSRGVAIRPPWPTRSSWHHLPSGLGTNWPAGEDDYIITVRDAFRALLNSGDITVPDCPPGYIFDCNGNCVPEMWLGNGVCDTQTWFGDVLVDFNCAALNFDEGDCDPCPADLDGGSCVDVPCF